MGRPSPRALGVPWAAALHPCDAKVAINALKSLIDLRRHFAGHPHIAFDDAAAHGGAEQRRHARIRFTHAPTRGDAEMPYRQMDLSQSGFAFFTSRQLERGTALALGGTGAERFAAEIVGCRNTSFDTSFIDRDFRFQVHCQFREVLTIPVVAELLGGLSALTLAEAD